VINGCRAKRPSSQAISSDRASNPPLTHRQILLHGNLYSVGDVTPFSLLSGSAAITIINKTEKTMHGIVINKIHGQKDIYVQDIIVNVIEFSMLGRSLHILALPI
jgi:hypothetical protein